MPLTRDQRTARALGAFLGFTTAIILAYWISREASLEADYDLAPNVPTVSRPVHPWGLPRTIPIVTGSTPVTMKVIGSAGSHHVVLGRREGTFDDYRRLQRIVNAAALGLFAFTLAAAFLIVNRAVRAFYPVNDLPDGDESLNMNVSGDVYNVPVSEFRNIESVVQPHIKDREPYTAP